MERIIEFRGKRKISGRWVHGYYVKMNGDSYIIDEKKIWNLVDDASVGQYTGMKDKYGVKIYRGDIIRFCDDPPYCSDYIIKYDDERMIWIADGVGDFMEDLWELGEDYVEVIGNIHDKEQQKQALIDTMRGDEEIGLYDDNPELLND